MNMNPFKARVYLWSLTRIMNLWDSNFLIFTFKFIFVFLLKISVFLCFFLSIVMLYFLSFGDNLSKPSVELPKQVWTNF